MRIGDKQLILWNIIELNKKHGCFPDDVEKAKKDLKELEKLIEKKLNESKRFNK